MFLSTEVLKLHYDSERKQSQKKMILWHINSIKEKNETDNYLKDQTSLNYQRIKSATFHTFYRSNLDLLPFSFLL